MLHEARETRLCGAVAVEIANHSLIQLIRIPFLEAVPVLPLPGLGFVSFIVFSGQHKTRKSSRLYGVPGPAKNEQQ